MILWLLGNPGAPRYGRRILAPQSWGPVAVGEPGTRTVPGSLNLRHVVRLRMHAGAISAQSLHPDDDQAPATGGGLSAFSHPLVRTEWCASWRTILGVRWVQASKSGEIRMDAGGEPAGDGVFAGQGPEAVRVQVRFRAPAQLQGVTCKNGAYPLYRFA